MGVGGPLRDELRRDGLHRETECVANLARSDDDRDARRESHGHRIGHITNQSAETGHAHRDEKGSGHERRHREPVIAELLDDAVNENDKSPGGATDLNATATQRRDEQPADDGSDEPLLRLHARGNRESDGERHGHHADEQTRGDVSPKLHTAVPLSEHGHKLRL